MKTLFLLKKIVICIVILFLSYACVTKENKAHGVDKNNRVKTVKEPVYVGEMYYLPETEEFYTPLFFDPEFDEKETNKLIAKADSVVYEQNNIKRRRIPAKDAKIAFMLSGLDSLFIYDTHHTLISGATLMRVEHLDDGIENKFVAVYKTTRLKTDAAERYYCTNNLMGDYYMPDFGYRVVNDLSLNTFVIHRLKRDPHAKWDITNVEVLPDRSTYSVVNSDSESFITELRNDQFNVVINMNRGYRVANILPLPFEFNQRPLMFISYYKYDENLLHTSLAVFADYQEYKLLTHNRLKIK